MEIYVRKSWKKPGNLCKKFLEKTWKSMEESPGKNLEIHVRKSWKNLEITT